MVKKKYVMAYHTHIHVFNLDDDDSLDYMSQTFRIPYSEYTF